MFRVGLGGHVAGKETRKNDKSCSHGSHDGRRAGGRRESSDQRSRRPTNGQWTARTDPSSGTQADCVQSAVSDSSCLELERTSAAQATSV